MGAASHSHRVEAVVHRAFHQARAPPRDSATTAPSPSPRPRPLARRGVAEATCWGTRGSPEAAGPRDSWPPLPNAPREVPGSSRPAHVYRRSEPTSQAAGARSYRVLPLMSVVPSERKVDQLLTFRRLVAGARRVCGVLNLQDACRTGSEGSGTHCTVRYRHDARCPTTSRAKSCGA